MAKRILYLLLALTGTFLAVYLSTNGSSGYSSFGGSVGAWINQTFFSSSLSRAELSALTHFGWKGIGHILLYLLTGLFYDAFLSTFPNLKKEKAILLGIGIAVSIAGELTQLFTPTRTAAFGDVVINFSSFMALPVIRGMLLRSR